MDHDSLRGRDLLNSTFVVFQLGILKISNNISYT